jgi:hypothetical protein
VTIEGRPQFTTPASAEQLAQQRAEAEVFTRARQEAAERSAPVRRQLLEVGPPLRDVDAAMECMDSCHPTVDVTDRHQGGTTCMCQLSPAQRAESRQRALGALARREDWSVEDGQRADAECVAADLGVQLDQIGGLAPFQITATVDGRSFYLRARHGTFTLLLAPEDHPALFVGESSRWGIGELEIASGDEDQLGSRWADALTFSVQRIRTTCASSTATTCSPASPAAPGSASAPCAGAACSLTGRPDGCGAPAECSCREHAEPAGSAGLA